MTLVANQNTPIVYPAGQDLQPAAYVNPAVPSNVTTISSNPTAFSDTIVSGIEPFPAPVATAANVIAALQAQETAADTIRRLTNPGEFTEGSVDYKNRPTISVIQTTTVASVSQETLLGTYDSWFCSNVQEQDVERTDITETFGSPHIFSSGRFTRKVTFGGLVRTTAASSSSSVTADRVPQHVLLRNFYERFLRSTVQAQNNTFTRITIDKDRYDGYIISLQIPRDAAQEMTMPFSMTMICVRRSNTADNDAASTLSQFVAAPTAQLPPSFAQASLNDASSSFALSIRVGSAAPGPAALYTQAPSYLGAPQVSAPQTITLNASTSGQILTVSGDTNIWNLNYSNGLPVNGTLSTQGDLVLSLVPGIAVPMDGSTASVLTIAAGTGAAVTLSVNYALPAIQVITVSAATATAGATVNASVASNAVTASIPSVGSAGSVSGTLWSIPFSFSITLAQAGGSSLAANAISSPIGTQVVLNAPGMVVPQINGAASTAPLDVSLSPSIDVSGSTISASGSTVTFSGLVLNISTPVNIVLTNPFLVANSLATQLTAVFTLVGATPITVPINLIFGFSGSSILTSLFDAIQLPWTFLPGGSTGTFIGTISVGISAAALGQGVPDSMFTTSLATGTFTLVLPIGVIRCALSGNSSVNTLTIVGQPTQIYASAILTPSATSILITIAYTVNPVGNATVSAIFGAMNLATGAQLSIPAGPSFSVSFAP